MSTELNPMLQYLDAALRRKWLIILPALVALTVAAYLAVVTPPLYQSETTILVEPQQIPENYVQSTVTGSVQDRLNIISQQILSRTRLESVIQQFNLYPEMRGRMPMEDVIHAMRKNIQVDVIEGGRFRQPGEGAAAAFKLAFIHGDPQVAQQVTMNLASMYIVENLKIRENLARETRSFLDKQLLDMETQLKTLEEAISVFKREHMGELPQQLEANLRTMEQLQVHRTSLQVSLRDAEARQISLDQQMADTPRYLLGDDSDREELVRQVQRSRQELASLLTRYTDQYPDVVRLRNQIRELEARMSGEAGETAGPEGVLPFNPLYARIQNQSNENLAEIRGLRSNIAEVNEKMRTLEGRVENIPKREQELMSLTRDYETIKQSYDRLMERRISASIAESLESRQKSEQFRILDPANYPQKPVKPDRIKILAFGLLAGVGIGGGISSLLEFLDRSLRRVEDVKNAFDLPVLGVIPVLTTDQEIQRRKKWRWVLALLSVALLVGMGIAVVQYASELKNLLHSLRG